jgi:hypothetical protein
MTLCSLKTSKGNDAVLHDGYIYRRGRELVSGEITWRCVSKSCKSSIRTDRDLTLVRESEYTHSHPVSAKVQVDMPAPSLLPACSETESSLVVTSPERFGMSYSLTSSTPKEIVNTRHNNESEINHDRLSYEDLLMVNESLREKVATLKVQWNAVVDHSIELDKRLLQLEDSRGVEVSCQTEEFEFHTCLQNPPHLEPRILVDRQCQSSLPDSHQCSQLVDEIRHWKMRSLELKMRLEERDADFSELSAKYSQTMKKFDEFQHVIETFYDAQRRSRENSQIGGVSSGSLCPALLNKHLAGKKLMKNVVGNKHKVVIVGDSHVRNLPESLNKKLSSAYQTKAYAFPGAPMNSVLNSTMIQGEIKNLTSHDFLFIIGGTNSFKNISTEDDCISYSEMLAGFVREFGVTNILVSTVPYRYDLPSFSWENALIKRVNNLIRNINGVSIIELWNAPRSCHTRHGLHFNSRGKSWIAGKLIQNLTSFCDGRLSTCETSPIIDVEQSLGDVVCGDEDTSLRDGDVDENEKTHVPFLSANLQMFRVT